MNPRTLSSLACLAALLAPVPVSAGPEPDSASLLGLPGTLRTLSAYPSPAKRWSHSAVGGFFISKDLAIENMDHSEYEASYALGYRPSLGPVLLSNLSLALQTGARADRVTNDEQNVTTVNLGDVTLGAHYMFLERERWALAAAIPVQVQPRFGRGPGGLSAGPAVFLAGSFRPTPASILAAHEADLNVGFRSDGTNSYLKDREEDVNRYNRVSRGQFSESAYVVQAAYRAEIGRHLPYVELAFWKDADGKAVNSKGTKVSLPFGSNPFLVTPGVKSYVTPNLRLELAVDLGVLSGGFPGENDTVPPWKLWAGLSWAHGGAAEPSLLPAVSMPPPVEEPQTPAAPPPPEPAPETPKGTYRGAVLDPLGNPLAATITVDGREKFQNNPADGTFSLNLDEGLHTLVFEGEGFETFTQEVDFKADAPVEQPKLVLKPIENIRVTGEKIVVYEKILFAVNRAEILPESHGILDQLVGLLQRRTEFSVRVEGHTDSRGRPASNLQLSQDRAESVVKYLVEKGVAPERLEAKGYGPDVPIADNETEEGRTRNRRVEFTLVPR